MKKGNSETVKKQIIFTQRALSACLALFIAANTSVSALASEKTYNLKEKYDVYTLPIGISGSKAPAGSTFSMADLAAMSNEELIDLLSSVRSSAITDLFKNTAGSIEFYKDSDRIDFLFDELVKRSSEFTPNDGKGVSTIAEVLRSGFYLAYYYSSDFQYMRYNDTKNKALPVYEALLANSNFKFGNNVQNSIIQSIGFMIGNSACSPEILNKFAPLIKDFNENRTGYFVDNSKIQAIEALFSGIGYVCSNEIELNNYEPSENLPSFGKIDDLINELISITEITPNSNDESQYVDNAFSCLSQLTRLFSDQNLMLKIWTDKMNSCEKYSSEFYNIAKIIEQNYKGVDSDGNKIKYSVLQKEGEARWLPNNYTFENGSVIVKTGDKVSAEKLKRMYWASKEVESQFFRINGNDKPLEPNNTDKVLTIKIFNTPEEYKMNYYLNDISTDNGGMYVEPYGTFYTYERTPSESVYTLEELYRHEFTHYLQGKYQIPGLWGQGDFYSNHEVEWMDEATAEFFAGSTRTEGVKPRYSIIGYLARNPEDRFTLDTLFNSGYASGWDFYNYGCSYITYLYENDIETLQKLNQALMEYDINGYRNILNEQRADSSIEKAYQELMNRLIQDRSDGRIGTPLVSDAYTAEHEIKPVAEIVEDIKKVSGVNDFYITSSQSPDFGMFKMEGIYNGGTSVSKIDDWKAMNAKADEILKTLSKDGGWDGYDTVTCYFTNYKVIDGKYQFNIVFRGLINDMDYFVGLPKENNMPYKVNDLGCIKL